MTIIVFISLPHVFERTCHSEEWGASNKQVGRLPTTVTSIHTHLTYSEAVHALEYLLLSSHIGIFVILWRFYQRSWVEKSNADVAGQLHLHMPPMWNISRTFQDSRTCGNHFRELQRWLGYFAIFWHSQVGASIVFPVLMFNKANQ